MTEDEGAPGRHRHKQAEWWVTREVRVVGGQGRGVRQAVLLAIAQFFNNEVHAAWPSTRALAERTSYSPATVKRAVSDLIVMGEVQRLYTRGEGTKLQGPNLYRLPRYDEQPIDMNALHRLAKRRKLVLDDGVEFTARQASGHAASLLTEPASRSGLRLVQ